eukprot:NODE_4031_length_501_cov_509.820796_g3440_i0.p1 GENE.NODE_4031_length_501_cov_509.820796_g3440_i0~~NODE_4031_length_501_cov_509.820796_g3440_i0.p1  ORF type:complete len:127 (-),score=36.24 NODE_4031_length_501_cov_509.820796_g3440_i0:119-445(-)
MKLAVFVVLALVAALVHGSPLGDCICWSSSTGHCESGYGCLVFDCNTGACAFPRICGCYPTEKRFNSTSGVYDYHCHPVGIEVGWWPSCKGSAPPQAAAALPEAKLVN